MTSKQLEKYFMRNARYYEGGLWNGNAERPRYGIRTPAPMRKLLMADDVAVLREKFNAYMREEVNEHTTNS